mmetsp:Transcript_7934/g.23632  ORF Transcript_7934/g.23632 Transcript_7934/m.23632 type:complete len:245 (-) Transcript_7934:855-1589(-)
MLDMNPPPRTGRLFRAREDDVADGDERVAGLGVGRHAADGVHGLLRVEGREPARQLQAPRLAHRVVRKAHVPVALEAAVDERPQLRVVLRREEDGRRRQAQRQVRARGLAQLLVVLREVEDVVDDLERQAQVVAVLLGARGHVRLPGVAREHRAALGRVRDERRGLVVALAQVQLHLLRVARRDARVLGLPDAAEVERRARAVDPRPLAGARGHGLRLVAVRGRLLVGRAVGLDLHDLARHQGI